MNGPRHIDLVGRVVLRRYRVTRELARGGMGVVYLARVEGAGGFVRPVVIKLVLPEHESDERVLRMFVREAKILSDLRHPSIVSILEFGEENGAYVMVLEYIHGFHLGQWVSYLNKVGRRVPVDILLLLIIDVLGALHKAHEMRYPDGTSMGVVHRDVSPSNILLDEDGRARVLDFGVARMRGSSADYQTQVPTYVGKFSYGAPELLRGAEASAQSDLYSAAVVLHEVLLGRNAFTAERDALTVKRVVTHQPEAIEPLRRDVPRGIDAVLAKALAKNPAQRFASAQEFALALRALMSESEGVLRSRAAAQVKQDFGEDMAEKLGIESLATRERSWRMLEPAADTPGAEQEERTMMVQLGWTETVQAASAAEGAMPAIPVAPSKPRPPASPSSSSKANKTPPPTPMTTPKGGPPPAPWTTPKAGPPPAPMTTPKAGPPPAPMTTPKAGPPPAPMTTPKAGPPLEPMTTPKAGPPPAMARPRAHVAATVRMPMPGESPRLRRRWILALALVAGLAGMALVTWWVRAPEPPPPLIVQPAAPPQPDPAEIARQQAMAQAEREAAILAARERALESREKQIARCFASVPKRFRPEAVELTFAVDGAGKPGVVRVETPGLARTPLARCLIAACKGVRFEGTGAQEIFSLEISP